VSIFLTVILYGELALEPMDGAPVLADALAENDGAPVLADALAENDGAPVLADGNLALEIQNDLSSNTESSLRIVADVVDTTNG
jgi:hypothetical protein